MVGQGTRRQSTVLPSKRAAGMRGMSTDAGDEGPVLPPRDPRRKPRGTTVNLPGYMWDQLDEIADASGEYSRNEVIQLFLENRILAWQREQATKKGTKKNT